MHVLILLGLSAMLAAEPAEPWSSSSSASRQAVDVVLEQCAIGSKYGLDGDLLRLYPLGKWDPLAGGRVAMGGYRWEGNPADYVQAIRELPGDIRIALTLSSTASEKEPTDWVRSVSLLKHLRGMTNVVEINLSGKLSDADLAEVRDLPGLEVLNVTEAPDLRLIRRPGPSETIETPVTPRGSISDAGLAALKELPALTELTLSGSRISGVGLAGLARLESLTLTIEGLSDEGIGAIGRLPNVEQLTLRLTDDASLAHLAGLTKLRQLTIRSSSVVGSGITGSGLQHLARLENLGELKLSYCYGITASGLESLAALTHLERLDLWNTWSDAILPGDTLDEMMVPVGRATGLRELILPGEVGDVGLAHLEPLQNLRSLKMYSTRMTDNGLKSVGKMAALEDFSISGPELSDESLAHLRSLHNLRSLSVPAKGITGPGLKYLPEIGRLESLRVHDVSGESLSILPRLPSLTDLVVNVPGDSAMAFVGRCTNLERLSCSANNVGDAGIKELSSLSKLRYLNLITLKASDTGLASLGKLSNLESLDLHAPGGARETVTAIARLTKLQDLHLVDVAMTDADVGELRALKDLRRLNVYFTGENGPPDSPTDAALASLWDDLPELVIDGPRGFAARKGQPLDKGPSY